MYNYFKSRFVDINYKTVSLIQGEFEESDVKTFKGYISHSLQHLIDAGVNVDNIKASIITSSEFISEVIVGSMIEVDGEYVKVKKIHPWRNPFGDDISTYEVLVD